MIRITECSIGQFSMDPKVGLKDGETGVSTTLKLTGKLDEELAREIGCHDSMYSEVSKVTSCKVEREDNAVRLRFFPLNGSNGKKPLLQIQTAGVHSFSAKHNGPSRTLGFAVSFEQGADKVVPFLTEQPGWVGDVEIEALQGELFAEKQSS